MHYILALTMSTFAICTSEFVIMGLLPEIAMDLKVSIPKAGGLVSAYAMGVVVGAPTLAVLTAKLNRKPTLLGLIVLFIIGNIFCAVAPTYNLLLAARIIAALCHGTFFGIASVVAADLAEPHNRSKAIAYVFMGATLANMLGVPTGTAIGQAFGWRATFAAVSLIGVAAIIFLKISLPNNIPMRYASPAEEFKALANKKVILPLIISVLSSTSLFCVFTYITPILRDVSGFTPGNVTIILLIFGVGLTVGSLLGGKLGTINMVKSLIGLFTALIIILIIFHFTMPSKPETIITIFLWSIAAFALNPMLQLIVVDEAKSAPSLASTFNQSAFNLGNAIGAKLGGILIAAGIVLRDLPSAAATVAFIGLAFTCYLTFIIKKAETV